MRNLGKALLEDWPKSIRPEALPITSLQKILDVEVTIVITNYGNKKNVLKLFLCDERLKAEVGVAMEIVFCLQHLSFLELIH